VWLDRQRSLRNHGTGGEVIVLKPLGHRILIQPDEAPQYDGLILLPEHRDHISTSGTVIALGPGGSKVRYDARQRAFREALEIIKDGYSIDQNRILARIGTPDPVREVAVGDRVAFDSESGLKIAENGVEYLILNEDDVVVIVNETEAVA
jgi:co-chaperonin GroES (HSP10)